MTPEQFAYWFQGFAELSPTPPTQEQWDSMRAHVATVFKKVTPEVKVTFPPADFSRTKPLDVEDAIRRAVRDSQAPAMPFTPNPLWPHDHIKITC